MKIETLRWSGDCLEMIDQRVFPAKFGYLRFHDARSVADGIRTMVVYGALAIGSLLLMELRWKQLLYPIYQKVILKRAC